MKKILIGGIGNVLLGDDGVGPYVAHLLNACYEFDSGVEVEDLGTPALDLIDRISAKDAVILIDSVDVEAEPGTVLVYRKADIMRLRPAVRMDPHAPALVDALLSAELFSICPDDVMLVGIKAESVENGCSLSAPVRGALLETISVVLGELERLGVEYKARERPGDLDAWWSNESALELSSR
jgi:hydrogenase maturation protease